MSFRTLGPLTGCSLGIELFQVPPASLHQANLVKLQTPPLTAKSCQDPLNVNFCSEQASRLPSLSLTTGAVSVSLDQRTRLCYFILLEQFTRFVSGNKRILFQAKSLLLASLSQKRNRRPRRLPPTPLKTLPVSNATKRSWQGHIIEQRKTEFTLLV